MLFLLPRWSCWLVLSGGSRLFVPLSGKKKAEPSRGQGECCEDGWYSGAQNDLQGKRHGCVKNGPARQGGILAVGGGARRRRAAPGTYIKCTQKGRAKKEGSPSREGKFLQSIDVFWVGCELFAVRGAVLVSRVSRSRARRLAGRATLYVLHSLDRFLTRTITKKPQNGLFSCRIGQGVVAAKISEAEKRRIEASESRKKGGVVFFFCRDSIKCGQV